MNGYISDKLTFTNALHQSPKYQRKLESYTISNTNPNYFIDDLFQMILLNTHMEKVQIRIVESAYYSSEYWNTKSTDNLYYSYLNKDFKKQRFLLSHLKEEAKDFREFYGARKKGNRLKKHLRINYGIC